MKKSTERVYRERILRVLVYAKLLGQWLPRSGRELRSEPSLEFYLNAPESTDPQDLITDIYAPLEPLI